MEFLYLFTTFFRIGLFSIGGGLATVPFLFEIADNSDWLTREAVGNMLAVAQSSPGAIGVNLASYVGYTYAGVAGGFTAVLGLVSPSIIIIIIVARMLKKFKENMIVQCLFTSFKPAAAGLLSAAGLGVIALSVWNVSALVWYDFIRWKEIILLAVLLFLIMKFKKHPVLYIIIAGTAGAFLLA
jgi:chromate transporter